MAACSDAQSFHKNTPLLVLTNDVSATLQSTHCLLSLTSKYTPISPIFICQNQNVYLGLKK